MLICASAIVSSQMATAAPARIRHVFVLMLENQSFESAFGKGSPAPYLAHELPAHGALLTHYYAIGHYSLDNYIALISGQGPNEATQEDCVSFDDFRLTGSGLDADGQAHGIGCIYPKSVPTLPDQLEAAGLTWRAYMEDMGQDPKRERNVCGHSPLNRTDQLIAATPRDQYASKHNPFVYFHAIIDDPVRCATHVVNLKRLTRDLQIEATTPNYVFITPNLCHDGHDAPCVDGEPGGLISIDAFLRHWVALITTSPAFRHDGLLIVTFDESDGSGIDGFTGCCGERPIDGARYPPGLAGPGGGRVGAVLLSPAIKAGTVSDVPYNHYSLLRSIESIFQLPPLGFAADPQLSAFGEDVFE